MNVGRIGKRSAEGTVLVDGMKLRWHLHREPQWCTVDGWKGLSISVREDGGTGRELLLEYPYPSKGRKMRIDGKIYDVRPHPPLRPSISDRMIETAVRQAIDAGWDPTSRGKAFAFQLPQVAG